MDVTAIIILLHKSVTNKDYDFVPTAKNRNSRRKYGLTLYDIEDFLKSITEEDLVSGPEIDRDMPSEKVYIFMKEIITGVTYRIKILSCHEAEY